MKKSKLIFRNLIFFRRTHLWVVLGTMISAAILTGALITGDSVRYSLRRIVLDRLGNTRFALSSGTRFFNTDIADKLATQLGTAAAPVLEANGIAITGGGENRLNDVHILGVDRRFGEIGGIAGIYDTIPPGKAVVNKHVAGRLGLAVGDEFLLRIDEPDIIPKDIPITPDSKSGVTMRVTVKHIAANSEFGGFNLNNDQVTPGNVFVSLDFLGGELNVGNTSNVLLVSDGGNKIQSVNEVDAAFANAWSLSDAGYKLTPTAKSGEIELTTDRIFLEPAVTGAAMNFERDVRGIFTYFVNELRCGDKTTPYSFVAGIDGLDTDGNDILINEWLADDLGAASGDTLSLTYFVLGESRSLIEKTAEFRIGGVVSMNGVYADSTLMPDFPGLADADKSREWDPGIPIDLDKIRDKDEDYWERYRGTPKAFLLLAAAQTLWQNRFGTLTAIRFDSGNIAELERALTGAVDPAALGFYFRDVKTAGEQASAHSVDFAGLFLGLSFFIIVAALLLTGLLYVFNIEQRSEETGLLLALGYTENAVKRLILTEGAVLVMVGSILGALLGVVYNQLILAALRTVWSDIVGTSAIVIHVRPITLAAGIVIGIIVNILTIFLVARNQMKQSIADLQKGIIKLGAVKPHKPVKSFAVGAASLVGMIVILALSAGETGDSFAFFFTAGALLLAGGVAFANAYIVKKAGAVGASALGLFNLGIRNTVRKRIRSLAVIGLLASGIFIVFTVGANRQSLSNDAENRASGTGGFALFGETVLPVLYDLNTEQGREYYGLDTVDDRSVSFVQFRVKEGDDASCLNLNRVAAPQLIAVDPAELTKRKAFTFVKIANNVDSERPWEILDEWQPGDVIPGIADQTVIVWGLGKAVGDTLAYVDESGRTFRVRLVGGLANSVFQGNVIISENAFRAKFPSVSGSNMFLADAPFGDIDQISQTLNRALEDQGAEIVPAYERLAQFAKVENTYLSIFLILGTFGLIIGSIGISIVIARNVSERAGELALLYAAGFERKQIRKLILSEHSVLLLAGILIGTVSALLAALPAFMRPGSGIPYLTILVLLCLVTANGILWTWAAASLAIGRDLLPALRNE